MEGSLDRVARHEPLAPPLGDETEQAEEQEGGEEAEDTEDGARVLADHKDGVDGEAAILLRNHTNPKH